MDRYPSNQFIARIQMTRNIMFTLTLKPTMKTKTTQDSYGKNDVQPDTAIEAESEEVSAHRYKEGKTSVRIFKKEEEDDTTMHETFQYEVHDDSSLWNFRFIHFHFGGLKMLHTEDMVKGLSLIEKPKRICEGCIFGKKHRELF
jgi:hypothetical protein